MTTTSAASGSRPLQGRYFENPTPVTGQVFCEVARSDEADVEMCPGCGARGGTGVGQDLSRRSAR